jgi:Glycosyltransferase family 87
MKAAGVNPRWFASALGLVYLFYWIFQILYVEWEDNLPLNQGPAMHLHAARVTNSIVALILVLALAMVKSNRLDRTQNGIRQAVLWPVLLIFFSMNIQYGYMHQKQAWAYIEDVGRTTMAADRLLLRGRNPYTAHLDNDAAKAFPGAGMDGYKYLPVMLASYLPWAELCGYGDRAVLLANMFFTCLMAGVLGLCVKKWVSLDAAILAAILFFVPSIIMEEDLRHGSNDIVPMIPLMLALYFLDKRLICGLLIGLAISAKLLPGALWLPIGLTPRRPRRYLGGLALGVLPCLPFFALSPAAFVKNIFLFNAVRPAELAAFLHGAPEIVWVLTRLLVVAIYLAMAWIARRREISPTRRCACAMMLAIGVQFASPMLHQNYFLWWFVPLCAVTTAFLFNPISYEWIESGRTPSGMIRAQ